MLNFKLKIFSHRHRTISILYASTDCFSSININKSSHLHFIALAELPQHQRVHQFISPQTNITIEQHVFPFLISLAHATCSTRTFELFRFQMARLKPFTYSRHAIFQPSNSHNVTINIIMSIT